MNQKEIIFTIQTNLIKLNLIKANLSKLDIKSNGISVLENSKIDCNSENKKCDLKIKYLQVYKGVDFLIKINQNQTKSEFILQKGKYFEKIKINYKTNLKIQINKIGDLVFISNDSQIIFSESKPIIIQNEKLFESSYEITKENNIIFQIQNSIDLENALIIDPEFSTYLGGTDFDQIQSMVIDSDENIISTGNAKSADFPMRNNNFKNYAGTDDVFISKINSTGKNIIWTTFIGSSGTDEGKTIKIDSNSNLIIGGNTQYKTPYDLFPTTLWAYNRSCPDIEKNPFLMTLSSTGNNIIYSTLICNEGNLDFKNLILDENDQIYFIADSSKGCPNYDYDYDDQFFQIVVGIFSSKSNDLLKVTCFGGSDEQYVNEITQIDNEKIVITGYTKSSDFPTTPLVYQQGLNYNFDCFVSVLNKENLEMEWSTYLGSIREDYCLSISSSKNGDIWVSGFSDSVDFPVTDDALQPDKTFPGENGIYFKLRNDGKKLLYSSYLPITVSYKSRIQKIHVDPEENILIAGKGLPLENYDLDYNKNCFFLKLYPNGSKIMTSVSVGAENIFDFGISKYGGYIFVGDASTGSLKTTQGSFQETNTGHNSGFLVETVNCGEGYYGSIKEGCTICPKGTYSLGKQTTCFECPAGSYSSNEGSSTCSLCPKGTFSNTTKEISKECCLPCLAGTYSTNEGVTNCSEQCPKGTFSNTTGAISSETCFDCSAGSYSSQEASTSCLLCPKGTYSDQTKQTSNESCLNCLKGTFSNTTASTKCLQCKLGTYSITEGITSQDDCKECPIGTISLSPDSSVCESCEKGYYAKHSLNQCVKCPRGTYSESSGSTECTKCKPGTYNYLEAQSSSYSCLECGWLKYNDEYGASQCKLCSRNTIPNSNLTKSILFIKGIVISIDSNDV
ncbi:cell surface glycoprotein (s-layer protein)-like protein [Anaeramoeba flamelloides]|uniref:Cell surface glycoprotein (S-layer protein)-like protein n=1 Tax=Anaeramoeba flamelloides TaxID=1746091 RepID=A0AAV7YRB6_9EUKA|nr:cell surface glycoprotein (s-layer protein)-like protein [Anaeramoeba flamelloides]